MINAPMAREWREASQGFRDMAKKVDSDLDLIEAEIKDACSKNLPSISFNYQSDPHKLQKALKEKGFKATINGKAVRVEWDER